MFNIGDVVVYGAQGVCSIEKIERKQMGKTQVDYYVLKPIFNDSTTVFVPVENDVLTAKMQSVLTLSQANELVCEASKISILEINDETSKREYYKNAVSGGDRKNLLSVIKTIKAEQSFRRQSGKKLNMADEQTLRKAEQLIYNELAFVLKITPDEAQQLIKL